MLSSRFYSISFTSSFIFRPKLFQLDQPRGGNNAAPSGRPKTDGKIKMADKAAIFNQKKKKKRENNNPKCISLSRARGKRQEATQIPRDSFSDMPTVSSINLAIYACSLFYAVVIET